MIGLIFPHKGQTDQFVISANSKTILTSKNRSTSNLLMTRLLRLFKLQFLPATKIENHYFYGSLKIFGITKLEIFGYL